MLLLVGDGFFGTLETLDVQETLLLGYLQVDSFKLSLDQNGGSFSLLHFSLRLFVFEAFAF